MTPDRWARVKAVFGAVVEAPEDERPRLLVDACAGDVELRSEVESLLAADGRASGRFQAPAAALGASFERETTFRAPEHLGPYRLLREIGRGGMGTIHLAVRDDDQYRKQVAIKLIRRHLASEEVLRRFRSERQIMADLDHPNIASLLDGGTMPDGHPYIVMEYIEGVPIDVSCAERRLDVRACVALFRQVCAAVQYAHQHLVVHRDLKPGNILVTEEGVPKLLDFGIARLFAAPGEPDFEQTLTEHRAMTPRYASPEQVLGRPVGTASDVYSLGVVLYELLTGVLPYRVDERVPHAVTRAICEEEPEKPSLAVSRARDASRPRGAARRVARALEGDLDNIVLMALRKDPERRYGSVDRLDDDLKRFLDGLPVRARPATLDYRVGKFIRRNRLAVAAAVLLSLSLAGGIVGTWRQARIAERRFRDTRRLANSILFELHDNIQNLAGATKARELLVKRALEYLNSLSREDGQDPTLLRELATAHERIGEIQGGHGPSSLGRFDAALLSIDTSLGIRRRLHESRPGDEKITAELASSLTKRALLVADRGRLREAISAYQEATSLLEPIYGRNPHDPVVARDLAVAYMLTGDSLGHPDRPSLGDPEKALAFCRKGYAVQEKLRLSDSGRSRNSKNGERRHFLAAHLSRLVALQSCLGKREEAERSYRELVKLYEDLRDDFPAVIAIRRDLAAARVLHADLLLRDDPRQALELVAQGQATFDDLAATDAANASVAEDQGWALLKEGELAAKEDPPRSKRALERALSIFSRLLAVSPGRARLVYQAARAHVHLAAAGDPVTARSEYEAARALLLVSRAGGNMDRRVVTLLFEIGERLDEKG